MNMYDVKFMILSYNMMKDWLLICEIELLDINYFLLKEIFWK